MMDIPATKSSPRIRYSAPDNTLTIIGESYPENSFALFQPLFDWLNAELPGMSELRVEIEIPYMNSSSTKCILDLLEILGDSSAHNCATSVVWRHEEENERALELAEEFQEESNVPFTLVPVNVRNPSR